MVNILNNKTTGDMSDEEIARWLCLFDAVNYVADKAEKIGIDINKSSNWIKPIAFKTYITEMYQSVYFNYKMENKKLKGTQINTKEYVY